MTEIKPSELTAEERAILDQLVIARMPKRDDKTIAWLYENVLKCEAGALFRARRALFSPAQPEPKREETVAEAPISEDHEYPSIGYDIELRKRWAALLGMDPEGYVCGVPAFVDIYSRCQELWPAPSPDPVEQKREECPNCGGKVANRTEHCAMDQPLGGPLVYDCKKPAPSPAPVAEEPKP